MYHDFEELADLDERPEAEQLTILLQRSNLIRFGKHLDAMFEARRSHMYTVDRNVNAALNVSLNANADSNT